MYDKECPELTPDVTRVEENHKYLKQELFSSTCRRRGEIHLPSRELETRVNKDIDRWRESEGGLYRDMLGIIKCKLVLYCSIDDPATAVSLVLHVLTCSRRY